MIEQRLKRLNDDMESLKASSPISGSLVRTYCYKSTSTKSFQDGTPFSCIVKFSPSNDNSGIVELSYYIELWTNSPTFSPYNPVEAYINSGYQIDSNGDYVLTESGSFAASDGSTYEVRVTAIAYGTLEGSVSISIY